METSGGHPEFFASVVKEYRRGRAMEAMRAAGGPGVPTWVKAEAKRLVNPRPVTMEKFDKALGWEPGSALRAYWHRQQPVPIEDGPPSPAAPLRAGADSVAVPLDRVEDLLGLQRDFHAAVDNSTGTVPVEELRRIGKALDDVVSMIVGRWATDMLEINRSGGSTHPGLAIALADALSVPVDPADPHAEDRLYRRWLAGGRFAAQIDDDRRERFQNRFDERLEGGENDGR